MIQPAIQTIEAKQLVGVGRTMSLTNFMVAEVWQLFMKQRACWGHLQAGDLFSVTVYPLEYFVDFHPQNTFEKLAAVELAPNCQPPNELATIDLPAGLYAVFTHRGLSTDNSIFQYIFTQWLPASPYIVDHRPHFEILSPQYQPNNPRAAETIYIPIRHRV